MKENKNKSKNQANTEIKKSKTIKSKSFLNYDVLLKNIFDSGLKINLSDDDIAMIIKDLTFTQAQQSRQAATLARELVFECDDELISTRLKECFSLDIISQILSTYLYGFNVFEVNYKLIDGLYYPRLAQRDYRQFKLSNGELIFKGNGYDEIVPEFKAIYALFLPNFLNPYGNALLPKLYFPIKIKNAGFKFWIQFLEKFGAPWAIGKTSDDPDALAEQINLMLNGDSAAIDTEENIELIQPKNDVGFEKIVEYCDTQINKVILGANLTSNVKSGSLAAAEVHNKIRDELAGIDASLLLDVVKRAVKFFKEINGIGAEIRVDLINRASINDKKTANAKIVSDMGYTLDSKFISKIFGVELAKDSTPKTKTIANSANTPKPLDEVDVAMGDERLKSAENELASALDELIANSNSYESAFNEFLKLYDLPLPKAEELLTRAIANSMMLGHFDE